MGTKRSGTKGSFTGQARELLMNFYREIVQPLKAWAPSAPKLRESQVAETAEPPGDEAIDETASR
jgi:hypothetical protein